MEWLISNNNYNKNKIIEILLLTQKQSLGIQWVAVLALHSLGMTHRGRKKAGEEGMEERRYERGGEGREMEGGGGREMKEEGMEERRYERGGEGREMEGEEK